MSQLDQELHALLEELQELKKYHKSIMDEEQKLKAEKDTVNASINKVKQEIQAIVNTLDSASWSSNRATLSIKRVKREVINQDEAMKQIRDRGLEHLFVYLYKSSLKEFRIDAFNVEYDEKLQIQWGK